MRKTRVFRSASGFGPHGLAPMRRQSADAPPSVRGGASRVRTKVGLATWRRIRAGACRRGADRSGGDRGSWVGRGTGRDRRQSACFLPLRRFRPFLPLHRCHLHRSSSYRRRCLAPSSPRHRRNRQHRRNRWASCHPRNPRRGRRREGATNESVNDGASVFHPDFVVSAERRERRHAGRGLDEVGCRRARAESCVALPNNERVGEVR